MALIRSSKAEAGASNILGAFDIMMSAAPTGFAGDYVNNDIKYQSLPITFGDFNITATSTTATFTNNSAGSVKLNYITCTAVGVYANNEVTVAAGASETINCVANYNIVATIL